MCYRITYTEKMNKMSNNNGIQRQFYLKVVHCVHCVIGLLMNEQVKKNTTSKENSCCTVLLSEITHLYSASMHKYNVVTGVGVTCNI